jgi:hypothetical protein
VVVVCDHDNKQFIQHLPDEQVSDDIETDFIFGLLISAFAGETFLVMANTKKTPR